MQLAHNRQVLKRLMIVSLASIYFILVGSNEIYAQSQTVTYSVENFFINDGLPVIRIYDTAQDHDGQIWVCTESGLFSFNGSEFELRLDFGKLNYYPNQIIFDNNSNIWLIKYKQYYSYAPLKELMELKIYSSDLSLIDTKDYVGEIANDINLITQNEKGILFFHADSTVFSFDQTLKKISIEVPSKAYFFSDDKYAVLSDSTDILILDSNTNKLKHRIRNEKIYYVNRYKQDLIFQFESGKYVKYTDKDKELSIISTALDTSPFFHKIIDKNDIIWAIGANWLHRFNLKTEKIESFDEDYFKSSSYLTSIFKDKEENIWIGSNQGLYKFSSSVNKQFSNSLPLGKSTRAIFEVKENEIYVSTYAGDLIYNLKSKKIKELSSSDIKTSIQKKGDYYYTASNKALRKIKVSDHKIIAEINLKQELDYIYNPSVLVLTQKENLVIKQSHTLRSIDEGLNLEIIYKDDSCEFKNLQVVDDQYYLSTTNGLKVMNHSFEVVKEYLRGTTIQYVHKDRIQKNILWLTTPSFLFKLDTETNQTKTYDTNSGFINSIFTTIHEDDYGNLWLPSFAGLNKFNKKSEEVKVYLVGEGITNNEFNNYSNTKLSNGEYVFGGIAGLTFVKPKSVDSEDIFSPDIRITECIKINSSGQIDDTKKVNKENKLSIEESDALTNIKFAHYSYKNLNSKIFRYRILNSSEKDTIVPWVNLKSNVLQLGKFPYGNYDLEFQAISKSGVSMSDINRLELEYVTPFMSTTLFKVFSILFLASFIYFIIHIRSQSLIQQKIALEKEVDIRTIQIQKQKEELEKINNTKDKLFSILAHDLKSPLITLKNISGKINYLIKKDQPDRIIDIGKTIEDKVSNLSIFLDNLLNWSLQQRGHITYNPIQIQLNEITEEILNIYEDHIDEKNLKVINEIPSEAKCFADRNSIHAVIRNLISNSIKYSPSGEVITLNFQFGKSYHIYSINDNGPGIEQKIIDSLYNNENIISKKGTKGESGTGLGLLISKDLVELNKGHIKFISNYNKGTKVEIHLPSEESLESSL